MSKINFKVPFYIAAILLLLILAFYFTRVTELAGQSKVADKYKKAKYVFLFIGDGMGMEQVQLTQALMPYMGNNADNSDSLALLKFGVTGFSTTHAKTRYITGSAAAGTALATGEKTSINTISKTADYSADLQSIAKKAKKRDMRVGIISSVSIDHATPAVFYANSENRSYYNYIASQMPLSEFDFFGGGYAKGNIGKHKTTKDGKHPDNYEAVDIEGIMENEDYAISRNRIDFNQMREGKNWAFSEYDSEGALSYVIDRKPDEISLAEYTRKAVELLDNENGFFLMVEGGKIDWACHANDAATVAHEVLDFDKAVREAMEFYKEHPDETLIVVTADHETGGLALGFSGMAYDTDFALLSQQTISSSAFSGKAEKWVTDRIDFEVIMDSVRFYYGLNDTSNYKTAKLSDEEYDRIRKAYSKAISGIDGTMEDFIIYGKYNPFTTVVTRILNEKAGIGWTTYSHTASPVPVFAKGVGQSHFSSYYDNTDIPKKIILIGDME